MKAIETVDIRKDYAGEKALKGVSLSADEGIIFGIIGADGAGKTTLMRICATLINADKGNARIFGFDTATQFREIRNIIGYMPQRFSLYQDLSVRENLLFFADVFGVKKKERRERMDRLLRFSRLDEFQKRRAANLSGGMKQKLALSCALIHTPKLLLLDEPTTGVDPVSRKEFWDILKELRAQGITILITTPYMDEATLCDSLLLIHKGETVIQGTPSELLKEYPCDLYKLSSDTGSVYTPQNTPRPGGVFMMYPLGGTLHIAVEKNMPVDILSSKMKAVVPEGNRMNRIEPSIEDLFFFTLSQKETETR